MVGCSELADTELFAQDKFCQTVSLTVSSAYWDTWAVFSSVAVLLVTIRYLISSLFSAAFLQKHLVLLTTIVMFSSLSCAEASKYLMSEDISQRWHCHRDSKQTSPFVARLLFVLTSCDSSARCNDVIVTPRDTSPSTTRQKKGADLLCPIFIFTKATILPLFYLTNCCSAYSHMCTENIILLFCNKLPNSYF